MNVYAFTESQITRQIKNSCATDQETGNLEKLPIKPLWILVEGKSICIDLRIRGGGGNETDVMVWCDKTTSNDFAQFEVALKIEIHFHSILLIVFGQSQNHERDEERCQMNISKEKNRFRLNHSILLFSNNFSQLKIHWKSKNVQIGFSAEVIDDKQWKYQWLNSVLLAAPIGSSNSSKSICWRNSIDELGGYEIGFT